MTERSWDEVAGGSLVDQQPESCPVQHCHLRLSTVKVQDSYGRFVTNVFCPRHGSVRTVRED
jgi:hypothetical protein